MRCVDASIPGAGGRVVEASGTLVFREDRHIRPVVGGDNWLTAWRPLLSAWDAIFRP
jgi:hypothetical protein